ncbi:MAG TPA: hypothetical protein VHP11_17510 [Tepidisphaeraceae bacterium]|nr:hypothetical protein [Tepidisphaeraceae bacterium]
MVVTFRQETVWNPPKELIRELEAGAAARGESMGYIFQGLYVEEGQFSLLEGRALYDVAYAPETVKRFESEKAVFVRRTVKAYAYDRAESLVVHSQTKHAAGRISNTERLPSDYPIDIALGLRCFGEQAWFDPSRLTAAECTITDGGRVLMRISDGFRPGVSHQWEVDPKAQDAIVGYQRIEANGSVLFDMKCSEFRSYGDRALPQVIEARFMAPAGKDATVVRRTAKVTVTEYSLESADNTPERYHISYPSGSRIEESRLNVPLQAATTRSFSDKEIFGLAKARDASIAPHPDPSNTLSRLIWIVASISFVVLLLLCAHRYRRSNNHIVSN